MIKQYYCIQEKENSMIDIDTKIDGKQTTFCLKGKLNSDVANEVKEKVKEVEDQSDEIILDFKELLYVSSAGLRVILEVHKDMKEKNKVLTITNVDAGNMEILDATGLSKFLNIKNG